MIIPAEIYEGLSTQERIRASIAAIARNDDAELKTLAETCPKKSYRMADAAFCDGMERLGTLALAVTSDLQSEALGFFLASKIEDTAAIHDALAVMASVEAAWNALLAERGINREEMAKASPARHRAVDVMLSLAIGEEIPECVEVHLQAMREYLAA